MKPLHVQYAPSSFDELVIANSEHLNKVIRLTEKQITAPLLVTGASSIGKSSFAKLTAKAMIDVFRDKEGSDDCASCKIFYPKQHSYMTSSPNICYGYNDRRMKKIKTQEKVRDKNMFGSVIEVNQDFGNHLQVSIIERVNHLPIEHQQELIAAIDAFGYDPRNFHIFVSNDMSNTLPELISLCNVIRLQPPSTNDWLVRLRAIAKLASHRAISDSTLLEIIKSCSGNCRHMLFALEEVIHG